MASLVRRGDSPSWWVSFVDQDGVRRFKTTRYRRDDKDQTKLARALEAELSAREHQNQVATDDELWANWVGDFLQRHARDRTLERYEAAWRELYAFLREKNIRRPRELTYKDAIAFLKWRTAQKRRGGKNIKLNTALNDMKVMRIVMRQAVRLGYATGNPCDRLGVAKEECKEKPEFSDKDIAEIRAGLVGEPEWMTICFEITLNTGCRCSDTRIHFQNIDFKGESLTFIKPKGGKDRAYTVPLPAALTPMLKRIKKTGASHTLDLPKMAGKLWWQFFGKIKRKDLCLHCARVTFVTRLHRAGVPTSAAMKLVNHSSTLVHKIYQRLGVDDLRQWSKAIVLPPATLQPPQAEISAKLRRRKA